MRKLKYYVACSVDGYIAQLDGSFTGFLQTGEHLDDLIKSFPETIPAHFRQMLGIQAENRCFDTVLMGRKTYDVGFKEGITSPYPHLKQYVFSRSLQTRPDQAVELVADKPIERVKHLKQETGQDIWLCGGASLAALLLDAQLIDELILKVNPFLMGTGIPLFSGVTRSTGLELADRKIYGNGVVLLNYRVKGNEDDGLQDITTL